MCLNIHELRFFADVIKFKAFLVSNHVIIVSYNVAAAELVDIKFDIFFNITINYSINNTYVTLYRNITRFFKSVF